MFKKQQGRTRHHAVLGALAASVTLAIAAPAAPAAVSVGHSGWSWGSPQPQGNTLNGLDFAGGRGYASGQFGTLLRTDDQGASWTGIATGITEPLVRVRAINADSVVIGGGCALRRSDDGGQSFRRLPWTPSDQSCPSELASFSFPSAEIGYLLTADGNVTRTADGGQSFSRRTSVPGTSSAGGAAPGTDIFFTGPDTGVAIARERIFRTNDGANSWVEVHAGPALNGLTFVDASVGYAVGGATTMLRSADGGQSWAPVALAGAPPGLNLTRLDCADPQTCLVAEATGARLLRTVDGGATAEAISPSTESILAVAFASPTRAVAVGEGGATVVSDNGGLNFSPVGGRISGQGFFGVAASQAGIAAAGGANGTIARSVDGGQTWTTVGVPTAAQLRTPSFPTADVGYALDSAGGAFKTTNGGASWSLLNTGTTSAPSGIVALDPNVVLLAGPKGIRRSTDGGNSFSVVSDKDVRTASLFGVGVISGDDAMVAGTKTVAISTNAGEDWSKVPLPGRRFRVFDLDMVSSRTGFVSANDGRLYRTSNGGRKWSELAGVGAAFDRSISFSSPSNGFAGADFVRTVAPDGFAMRTTDGGRTWQPQLVASAPIEISDAGSTGFANTSSGEFFATSTGGEAGTPSTLTIQRVGGKSGKSSSPSRKAKKARIAGELSPPEGGETIYISSRSAKGTSWKFGSVTAASNGEFTTNVKVSKPTFVVAQWLGDDDRAGAGSTVLKVNPPKKKRGR